jgi:hypothetical protein
MLLGMDPDYVRQGLLEWCERSKEVGRDARRRPVASRVAARIVPAQPPELVELSEPSELMAIGDHAA